MDPTLETLHALHSTHGQFSDRDVSEADLTAVLEAATRAANSSSRQAYSIIVVGDRERIDRLVGYRASRALVFCIDFHRLGALAARLGRAFDNDNILEFLTGLVDAALAAQTAVIAARALGIDSLVTNGLLRRSPDLVDDELSLPERSVFPLITVLLGYGTEPVHHAKRRLPLEHIVCRDRYRQPDAAELDRIIAAYDDREAGIGLLDMWNPDEYAHYLDWFFERWCTKPAARRVLAGRLKEVQDRLVASGFWWPDR